MGISTSEKESDQLMDHVRKLDYHARELLKQLGSVAPERQAELRGLIEPAFRKLWTRLVNDSDLTNKREVYAYIAAFLGKHFSMPPLVCQCACLQLFEETDSALLEEVKPNRDELAQASELLSGARDLIVAIKVRFELSPGTTSTRKTEIWYAREKQVASASSEVKMAWEDLPADVRADYLKEQKKEVTYKLYPKE